MVRIVLIVEIVKNVKRVRFLSDLLFELSALSIDLLFALSSFSFPTGAQA